MVNKRSEKAVTKMFNLRLKGHAYAYIAKSFGVSRQRIQQLISPPRHIRDAVVARYKGECADCRIHVGNSGNVHHVNLKIIEDYNDAGNLVLLCVSCHLKRHYHHGTTFPKPREGVKKMKFTIRQRAVLTKMAKGTVLYNDVPYGRIRLDGGEYVNPKTFRILLDNGLIYETSWSSGIHDYAITDKGRQAINRVRKEAPPELQAILGKPKKA